MKNFFGHPSSPADSRIEYFMSERFPWPSAVSGVGSSPTVALCETSQVLLAGVPGGFSQDSPIFAHQLIGPSHMS